MDVGTRWALGRQYSADGSSFMGLQGSRHLKGPCPPKYNCLEGFLPLSFGERAWRHDLSAGAGMHGRGEPQRGEEVHRSACKVCWRSNRAMHNPSFAERARPTIGHSFFRVSPFPTYVLCGSPLNLDLRHAPSPDPVIIRPTTTLRNRSCTTTFTIQRTSIPVPSARKCSPSCGPSASPLLRSATSSTSWGPACSTCTRRTSSTATSSSRT